MDDSIIDEKKKNEILYQTEQVLHYNNLLIKQCDGWLSPEEGNANLMKIFIERGNADSQKKQNKLGAWLFRNKKTN